MKEAVAIKTARSKVTREKPIITWKKHKQNTALKIDGTFQVIITIVTVLPLQSKDSDLHFYLSADHEKGPGC